jgi:hypothetical protein
MDLNELMLRERIQNLLETYTFEEILEQNGDSIEDILVYLYFEYGLQLPEVEPL